jgi:hypothetical protein
MWKDNLTPYPYLLRLDSLLLEAQHLFVLRCKTREGGARPGRRVLASVGRRPSPLAVWCSKFAIIHHPLYWLIHCDRLVCVVGILCFWRMGLVVCFRVKKWLAAQHACCGAMGEPGSYIYASRRHLPWRVKDLETVRHTPRYVPMQRKNEGGLLLKFLCNLNRTHFV